MEWIKAFFLTIKFFKQFEKGNINNNNNNNIKKLLNIIDNMIDELAKYPLKSIQDEQQLETFTGIVMDYCVSIKKQSLFFFLVLCVFFFFLFCFNFKKY